MAGRTDDDATPVRGGRSIRTRLTGWLQRLRQPAPAERLVETCFGPLELRVLDALWRQPTEVSVRKLMPEVRGVAYTTLMTTLDRLYKKGALTRRKEGRAYIYTARLTAAELEAELATDAFDLFFTTSDKSAAQPLLSGFVDAVSRHDEALLGELETMIRARRRRLRQRPPQEDEP